MSLLRCEVVYLWSGEVVELLSCIFMELLMC